MTQLELLDEVAAALNHLGIGWMLVGSYAAAAHGHPRTTHDIDVVAQLSMEHVEPLVELLGDQYYLSREALTEAIERGTPANVIHAASGDKLDIWPLGADAYQVASFQRRQEMKLGALAAFVQSPEDTILSKLRWQRESQSARHHEDAVGVAVVQYGHLDLDYMRHWAEELGLTPDLCRLLDEAEASANAR
ncbi:MAG: hypothetical protein ACE5R4_15040 [Armatimonadota bacterium]